jgi:hypothetical protein
MFNPDFYPTPELVAAMMLDPLDLRGRVVVEPSAGSGNLPVALLRCSAASLNQSSGRSFRPSQAAA